MRPRLKSIRYNGDFRFSVAYDNGLTSELDFDAYLATHRGPMTEPLREEDFLGQAFIDHGVMTWPNGYDICPDVLLAWCEAGRILSREEMEFTFASRNRSGASPS